MDRSPLRLLLGGQLPLARVGPGLRRAARRAVAAKDPERMRAVARAVVGELIRQGELVPVVPDGTTSLSESIFLLRGTSRLLDLGFLLPGPSQAGRGEEPARPGRESALPAGPGVSPIHLAEIERTLRTMELAQNLRVGDPLSGEPQVILENTLVLLGPFLPQLHLFVLLHGDGTSADGGRRVFFVGGELESPSWFSGRARGSAVWIRDWMELPDPLKLALADWQQRQDPGNERSVPFTIGLALPLVGPESEADPAATPETETGLLFLIPQFSCRREVLFRIGRRLVRFVTERWRNLWQVNQRILTDRLTGVPNRAYFDPQFVLELERAKRRKSALTLILADLDHFKQVNDHHGHQAGDVVLQEVALLLQRGLRRIDQVCRIGGEEFALLLPNTDNVAAREVLGRLLASLARLQIEVVGVAQPVVITLSFGGVGFPDGGSDPFELYRKADSMLYLAKEAGRNRCYFWNPHGEPVVLLPESADA